MTPRSAAPPSILRASCRAIGLAALALAAEWTSEPRACGQQSFVPPAGMPYPSAPQAIVGPPMPGQPSPLMTIFGTNVSMQASHVDGRIHVSAPYDSRGQLTFSTKNNLQLQIRLSVSPQFGYCPIEIIVRAAQPVPADKTVQVTLSAGTWGYRSPLMTISQPLTIPKGQTEASSKGFLPQYQAWQFCRWETTVEGREDEELSYPQFSFGNQSMGYGVSAMILGDGAAAWQGQSALQALANVTSPTVRKPDELPDDWLEYSGYDIVAVDAALLPAIAASQPAQRVALLRWLRSGGNLWVFNCGRRWERLGDVEPLLGVEAVEQRDGNDTSALDAAIPRRGWRYVPLNERVPDPIEGALLLSGYDLGAPDEKADDKSRNAQPATTGSGASPSGLKVAVPREVNSENVFCVRALGLGLVAAFRGSSGDLSSSVDATTAVQQSVLALRAPAAARYGNKPDEGNAEFNNWLIPGVGVAPVGLFQFLITLFVLAIGPLNYWWLNRRKKLPLLLATVPATAAAVTLLLLAYGTLSDGLGTRVRARSLTYLDQRSGEATSWGRLSYFAGVRPRDGLTFPADVAVHPILPTGSSRRYGGGREHSRSMTWGRNQQLISGWLPSRTSTQYLSVASRGTKKQLTIRPTAEGVQVDNRLGVDVTHLVVQDDDGKLYWLENLPANARKTAPKTAAVKIKGIIRELFADNYLEFPAGAEPTPYNGGYSGASISQGLLEANLEAINSPLVETWINRSYIAVTKQGVELNLGLTEVREEASFHVVRGLW